MPVQAGPVKSSTVASTVARSRRFARRLRQKMGVQVTGSLGILLRAKRLGYIDTVAPHLEAMRRAERVLREAGESDTVQRGDPSTPGWGRGAPSPNRSLDR